MQNLEQKGRISVLPNNSRYSVDPRISHQRPEQLKAAFDAMDADGSGYLTLDEIMSFLREMNDEVDDEYVKSIFDSMDRNGDGKVIISEFMDGYLQQVNGLSEAVARLKQSINEKKLELDFYNEQLIEAKNTEVLNPFEASGCWSFACTAFSQEATSLMELENTAAAAIKKEEAMAKWQEEADKIIRDREEVYVIPWPGYFQQTLDH